MKSAKRIFVLCMAFLLVTVFLLIGAGGLLTLSENPTTRESDPDKISTHNRAIIMVPGFLGSSLVDDENTYWLPLQITSAYLSPRIGDKGLLELMASLILSENGSEMVDIYAPTMKNDMDMVGGTCNFMLPTYEYLVKHFSRYYDVMHFQYDWRMSNMSNALLLDDFIKENEWSEVILLCHSMGGLLGDCYLSLGQEQRDKVALFATFGSPHGGAMDALYALETGKYDVGDVPYKAYVDIFISSFLTSLNSIYDMLPNELFLSSPYYRNAEGGHSSFIKIEREKGVYEYLTEWEDVLEFYSTRKWTKYDKTPSLKGQVKQQYTNWLSMMDKLYFGETTKKHISESVNTLYYTGGRGSNMIVCIQYNLNGTITPIYARNVGDDTIAYPSASCGKDKSSANVRAYDGYSHIGLYTEDNENIEDPLDNVSIIIDNFFR